MLFRASQGLRDCHRKFSQEVQNQCLTTRIFFQQCLVAKQIQAQNFRWDLNSSLLLLDQCRTTTICHRTQSQDSDVEPRNAHPPPLGRSQHPLCGETQMFIAHEDAPRPNNEVLASVQRMGLCHPPEALDRTRRNKHQICQSHQQSSVKCDEPLSGILRSLSLTQRRTPSFGRGRASTPLHRPPLGGW